MVSQYCQAGVTCSYRSVVFSSLMSPLSPTAGMGTYAGHSSRENCSTLAGTDLLSPYNIVNSLIPVCVLYCSQGLNILTRFCCAPAFLSGSLIISYSWLSPALVVACPVGVGPYAGHSLRWNSPALERGMSLPPVLLLPSPTASYAGPSSIVS